MKISSLSEVFGPAASPRLESVQVLRGVAAMLVVFNHAGYFLAIDPRLNLGHSYLVPSQAVALVGGIGVDLFFVISGFVMALGARRFTGVTGAGVFLVQRFIRIAPFFYLACLVMLADALRAGIPINSGSLVNSLIFIPIFDGETYSFPMHQLGWTLAFEWVFYLLVALVIADRRGGEHKTLLAVVMLVPLIGLVAQPQLAGAKVLTNPMLWEFALGIVACILHEQGWLSRVRSPLLLCSVLLLATGAASLWVWPDQALWTADQTVSGEASVARALIWGVPAFVFFCTVVSYRDIGDSSLARLMKLLGDASYSIYLSHIFLVMFLRQVLDRMPFNPDLVVLVTLLLSAAGGIYVYRWVEKPLLRAGQKSIRRWSMHYAGSS